MSADADFKGAFVMKPLTPYCPANYNMSEEFIGHQIEPGLFLGGSDVLSSPLWFDENKIDYVLSIMDESVHHLKKNNRDKKGCLQLAIFDWDTELKEEKFVGTIEFRHKHLVVDDFGKDPDGNFIFDKLLPVAIEFIQKARTENKNIYVHCRIGRNRSATVIATYLALKQKISFQEALEQIKKIRTIVNPLPVLVEVAEKYIKENISQQ
jgi:protein-tyrosine phosphatase